MVKTQMKLVKGFTDYYITKTGELYSTKKGVAYKMKPNIFQGYERVKLIRKDKTIHNTAIHRLVAEAYLTKPKGKNIVNHIDGVKSNNHVSNLEWTNHRGNMDHYKTMLAPKYKIKKDKQKQDLIQTKLSVLNHAFSAYKDNPEEFAKIYGVTFG